MPISYTIDSGNKLITEVWVGEIDAACLAAYWKRYLADPEVMEIRRTLVDLRRANILFKGSDLLVLIQTIVLPAIKGRDWKSALVVEKSTQYGVSRQYQAFADHYSKDAIFHDMEEARQWLTGLPGL
jgi:hypothetical protein